MEGARELDQAPPPAPASSDAEEADARASGEPPGGVNADALRSTEPYAAAPVELLGGSRPMGAPHGAGTERGGSEGTVTEAGDEFW